MEQVLLVTGGSRGIGAATALLAAAKGYAVAVNYTAHPAAADEVVGRIRAGGGRAIAVRADVAQEDQVLALFEQVDRDLGRLTALVNNAGVVDVQARLDEMSVARLKRMFDINVIGALVCAREAALDTFTMAPPLPPRRVLMRLTASRAHTSAPITLMSNMRFRRATLISSSRAWTSITPALFTSAVRRPSSRST